MSRLMENKVGIVTAAGNGIGRASALAFAEEGAKVVVSDISEEAGKETVQLITEKGGEAIFIPCNVADEADVKNLVQQTIERYGQLDWAHNNAGIGAPTAPVTETDTAHWKRAMGVNLDGMYFCLKHEIPAMIETGGGAIVNTASTGGLAGTPGLATYTSSKWGVNGLTKTVALEFGKKGVRVNSICPGMTKTKSVASWSNEAVEQAAAYEANIPMGRMGTPEEQANAAVWLCSDKASYITGVNLPVDGGETAE
ncbi:SDR family NAD(P)-dependent oxidoreductase [Oceanobacillus sojae]|uniref:SDR family NAD(P)-dependent oxidoreductase n=1 Tax=Oceanobacillus sojae TaxID=582851 RepID=UPI00098864EE|nr:glucose 1-dehydrogenase [Oceanobacillus sojae]MCT1904496.1 glucose 1-dehydrogenase [Oceanobacillus sojae]